MSSQGSARAVVDVARREVLGRLLALDNARYEEEVQQELHEKGATKAQGAGAAKAGQAALRRLGD